MKTKSLVPLFLAIIFSCFFVASSSLAQDKKPEVKLSEAETKALNAINALTDPAAKLKAVEDFVKKYPKTPIRVELANTVAEELAITLRNHGRAATDPAAQAQITQTLARLRLGDKSAAYPRDPGTRRRRQWSAARC